MKRKIIVVLIVLEMLLSILLMPIVVANDDINNTEEVKENIDEKLETDETEQNDDEIINQTDTEVVESNTETTEKADDEKDVLDDSLKDIKEDSEEDNTIQENNTEQEEIKEPILTYSTHVQEKGWQNEVSNDEIAGTQGEALRLEAIKIKLETQIEGSIQYSTHIQNIGWQGYVENGEISGTTGKSYRIEAIKIRLTGELKEKYDIYYRAHVQEFGWLAWTKNGEKAGTEGCAYRLEAIQIQLVEKGTQIDVTGNAFITKPDLKYSTHIQNIGWQNYVINNHISGTTGQGLRLEAIKLKINTNLEGNIEYSTHIQNIGWEKHVSNNSISGTTGQGLRLEAIKIRLTGEIANYYDIYYRTHVENMGWLAWAKNGEEAGTERYAYRLEASQVVILSKSEDAPSNTRGHFYVKALERKSIEGIKLVFGDVCAGIDVSVHNGDINWQAVKSVADFAIIRCGYGQNFAYQDDSQFEANMQGCILNNIPIEVYLYSYADTVEKASSEADHVMRLCDKYKSKIRKIWYDVEDNSVFSQIESGSISKEKLEQIVDTFANKLNLSGYNVGLYTYSYALDNYFPTNIKNKYKIWIANYPGVAKDIFESKYTLFKTLYQMWQFTASGVVNGIVTNVDLNIRF